MGMMTDLPLKAKHSLLLAFDAGPLAYPTGLAQEVLDWLDQTGCEQPYMDLWRSHSPGTVAYAATLRFKSPEHAFAFKMRWL